MAKIIFFLFLFAHNPIAHASLFFSPQEVTTILAARMQNKQKSDDCLECNGVFFQNQKTWSVWIQGKKLTAHCPQCRDQTIKILSVDQSYIRVEWLYKGERHLVTLQPNQFYNATLKKVIKTQ